MKKLLLLLLFVFGAVDAQIVNIPDANFKSMLVHASANYKIASIQTPISNLINLVYLNCYNNHILNLDLTTLTNLETLICSVNNLTSLNLNFLTNLRFLDCSYNSLTSLNVSNSNNLIKLTCSYNQLTN